MVSDDPSQADPAIPASVLEKWGPRTGRKWELVWSYPGDQSSWRITSTGEEVLYLKAGRSDLTVRVASDCERTRWAFPHLPVPRIVDCGTEAGVDWMLNTALPGVDATSSRFKSDRERLVTALGEGLRRFHDAPVDSCPYDFGLRVQMERVRDRVFRGLIKPEQDLHEEFAHHTPESAIAQLVELRPDSEDLVVCHGDYCLPNVTVENWEAVGYMDLGELGVSDRWWDVAVGAWSVTWNLGAGLEGLFYDSYGIEPDPNRIIFYRLLYDLVS